MQVLFFSAESFTVLQQSFGGMQYRCRVVTMLQHSSFFFFAGIFAVLQQSFGGMQYRCRVVTMLQHSSFFSLQGFLQSCNKLLGVCSLATIF